MTHAPSTVPPITAGTGELRTDRDPFAAMDWLLMAGLSLVWGSSFLLMAVGLESLHPGVVTWLRVVSGAAALLVVRRRRVTFEPDDQRRLVLLAVTWVVVPFTLFPIAEQHVNSAVAGILNGATPIWAALVGAVWFGRPSRGLQRIGLVVGFVGMVVVSVSSSGAGGDTAVLGIVLVLVATLLYGWSLQLLGPLQHRYGAVPVARRLLVLASVATTPFGLWGLRDSTFEPVPVLATLVLGVVGTGIAFVMMSVLAGRVGGSRASFVTYVIPVVAVALGMVVLGDEVQPAALAGVVLVIAGAVAASRREA
ncbi:DMT family transporter [Salsipaludibacter albus]|uniref:DMT family transporter n=1 Tax=Salsipaludibacter albus TaxID=2849650 RepID=UPI001EE4CB1A|nr:DMT family transporter [Salsipaludibacter albus]MBY5161180.1 DMT family transporter [Salsipaludibacter albus]